MCVRPSSVATQTIGAAMSACDPYAITSRRTTSAKIAGKSAMYATSAALTRTATHVDRSPYITITRVIQ